MADSVKIRITGDDRGFRDTLSGLGQTASSVFKGMMRSQIVTRGFSMMTGSLRNAVDTGMQFGSAMSQVAAISGATGAELDFLTETAKRYGETTMFSASQAAEALNYMALAGWDTNQSIEALPGVLDMAAASGMGLAAASDAVTDYISAFGLEAKDATYMADAMAKAQATANTSAQQLSEAWGNSAASMHAAGQDMETTTAALMIFADQGMKGSEAGTALSAMMRDITQKMEDGAIKIGDTTIAVQDAQGNFRDLNAIIADVTKATEGMGSAEKSAALMTTFTARSIKGVNMLLNAGVEELNKYEAAVRGSAGTAAEQAETMMDNLQGDVQIFKSALEGLQITASESMDGTARTLVQEATEIVNSLNQAGKRGGLNGIIDGLIDQVPKLLPKVTTVIQKIADGVKSKMPSLIKGIFSTIPDLIGAAGDILPTLADAVFEGAASIVQNLVTRLPELVPQLLNGVAKLGESLVRGAYNLVFSSVDAVYRLVTNQVGKAFTLDQAIDNILEQGRQGEHILTLSAEVNAEVETNGAEAAITSAITGIKSAFETEGLTIDTSTIVGLINKSDAEIIAACKGMGLSEEGAQYVVEQVRGLETSVSAAISDLNLGDEELNQKVSALLTSADTSKAELIAELKELSLTPTEIAEILAIYETMNGDLSSGVPNVFDNVAKALTDGKTDSPDIVGELHDEIQGWFDDAVADVDAWAELEISKLDPTEAGYDDAVAEIKTKAGELKTELIGVKNSADAWVNANANVATETVEKHIGELEGIKNEAVSLSEEIDAMTENARGKVSSVGENAYRTIKIGGKADAGTIDLAFTWSYNGHKDANAAAQEAYEEELRALQANKQLTADQYNEQAGALELELKTQLAINDAEYIVQLRDLFAGLAESMLSSDDYDVFYDALGKMDLASQLQEWANTQFLDGAETIDWSSIPDALREGLDAAGFDMEEIMKNTAWSKAEFSSWWRNDVAQSLQEGAKEELESIDWGDLAVVFADAVDTGLFKGTELEGLEAEEVFARLFGGLGEDAEAAVKAALNDTPAVIDEAVSDAVSAADPEAEVEADIDVKPKAESDVPGQVEEAVESAAEDAAPEAKEVDMEVTTNVVVTNSNAAEVGGELGRELNAGIAAESGGASEAGSALGSAAASGARTAYAGLYSAGSYAGTGFYLGFLSKRGQILRAAYDIANSVSATIRAALQISSPSRVLMQLGEYTGEGYGIGLRDSLQSAIKSARSVVDVANLSPKMDYADVINAVRGVSSSVTDFAGIEAERPIELYVNGKLLGRVMARDNIGGINQYNRSLALGRGSE